MGRQTPPADDYAWEKEFAPKISKAYLAFVSALFCLFMGAMTVIAFHRWFGELQ